MVFFDKKKELSGSERESEKSFVKKIYKKLSPQQRREKKKVGKVREFLKANFQLIAQRMGALIDFFAKARSELKKLMSEGMGLDKAPDDHKGYYSSEDIKNFKAAAVASETEENRVAEMALRMYSELKRDISHKGDAMHLTDRYDERVTASYTRYTSFIEPVILRPKSNLPASKSDSSAQSVNRLMAGILLGMQLANTHFQTINKMESVEFGMAQVKASSVYQPGPELCEPGPPGIKVKSLEEMKKELDQKKTATDGFKDQIKFFTKIAEGKKYIPRLANNVDVTLGETVQGKGVRNLFGIKLVRKTFKFGVWNEQYT